MLGGLLLAGGSNSLAEPQNDRLSRIAAVGRSRQDRYRASSFSVVREARLA
jgi:hypothetical protein